jgi:hypothetical protein
MDFVVALNGRFVVTSVAAERQKAPVIERMDPEVLDLAALMAAEFTIEADILRRKKKSISAVYVDETVLFRIPVTSC